LQRRSNIAVKSTMDKNAYFIRIISLAALTCSFVCITVWTGKSKVVGVRHLPISRRPYLFPLTRGGKSLGFQLLEKPPGLPVAPRANSPQNHKLGCWSVILFGLGLGGTWAHDVTGRSRMSQAEDIPKIDRMEKRELEKASQHASICN
jgi:hypothetical protein